MLMTYRKKDGSKASVRIKEQTGAPPITIGRGKIASVVLEDEKCSRIHCAIRYWDDIFVIRDCRSSNGTELNGNKVEVAKLVPGDDVVVGDTKLSFVSEARSGDATMKC